MPRCDGQAMTIQRLENVGIVVDDLAAATTFFVELVLVERRLPALIAQILAGCGSSSKEASSAPELQTVAEELGGSPRPGDHRVDLHDRLLAHTLRHRAPVPLGQLVPCQATFARLTM